MCTVGCDAARIALRNSKEFYRETLETRIEKDRERERERERARERERENDRWKTKGFGLSGLLLRELCLITIIRKPCYLLHAHVIVT